MHWFILFLASVFEGFIPLLIIRTDNFTHLLFTSLLLITVISSVSGLRYAMTGIPLGIAYLVWTSLGIVGSAFIGCLVLGEQITLLELASIGLIIIAVTGLQSGAQTTEKNFNH